MKRITRPRQELLVGKRRTTESNKALGRHLAFIAGAINAGGFMVVQQYTSHMTGILSLAVDSIALNHWLSAVSMIFYILFFICGAATTAIMVLYARTFHMYSQYALPLAFEALLLIMFGITNSKYMPQMHLDTFYIIALLCYLMGLQNAVITKLSDTAIRTTHITGMVTDIGIEIGKLLFFCKKGSAKHTKSNKDKISLHLSIVLSFLIGGVSGAYGFKYIGFVSVLPLAGYLLFISYMPIRKDFIVWKNLRKRRRRTTTF